MPILDPPALNPADRMPATDRPRLTIVIPAKNEAGSIAAQLDEIETRAGAARPLRGGLRGRWLDRRQPGAARPPCATLAARRAARRELRQECRRPDRRQGRPRPDRVDPRRRRPERPGLRAAPRRRVGARWARRRARGRAAPAARRRDVQEAAVADRQPGAPRDPGRRHPRHRLRPEGVPARRVPQAAVLRRVCTASCRPSSNARASASSMSMSSTGPASPASRITASSTGCGAASSTCSASGG